MPSGIRYISEYPEFYKELPTEGKVICNKTLCGCGFSNYILSQDYPFPTILTCPRKEMIHSKENNRRLSHLHYFSRENGLTTEQGLCSLFEYLRDEWNARRFPKVMVTYDSLSTVVNAFRDQAWFSEFAITVDEFNSLFTDVRLKSKVELDVLQTLDSITNRAIFVSATPEREEYLNEVSYFKNMPYLKIDWEDVEYVRPILQKMTSVSNAFKCIYARYLKQTVTVMDEKTGRPVEKHYFETKKDENGKDLYSFEGVFYLNNVYEICNAIRDSGLKLEEVRVICSDKDANVKKLNNVLPGLRPSHFPTEDNYKEENVAFTFVTRASFEGADHYSDSSSTYIFSNPDSDVLALNITTDLPQIVGRCRTKENPFRTEFYLYFKTTDFNKFDDVKEMERILNRKVETEKLLNELQQPNVNLEHILNKIRREHQKHKDQKKNFVDDYLDFQPDGTPINNELAYSMDLRAYDIRKNQYSRNFQVYATLDKTTGFSMSVNRNALGDTKFNDFYREYEAAGSFMNKLKVYCEGITDPEIESWAMQQPDIPKEIKEMVKVVTPEKCKALNYQRSKIQALYDDLMKNEEVAERLDRVIKEGQWLSLTELKRIFHDIYDSLGVNMAATASAIKRFFQIEAKPRYINGKTIKGYSILCKRTRQ